jgi:hypothetical protein
MPHRRLTKESVASKKETLPKRITDEYLEQFNLKLCDLLQIMDFDEFNIQRRKYQPQIDSLTVLQKKKLGALDTIYYHFFKLFFIKYPDFDEFWKTDKDSLYEDFMGRKYHPTEKESRKYYDWHIMIAKNKGVLK